MRWIEKVDPDKIPKRYGWSRKVIQEFMESGWKCARVKLDRGENVHAKATLLRMYIRENKLPIRVMVRDGNIYLIRLGDKA